MTQPQNAEAPLVKGRNRYADEALTTVVIRDPYGNTLLTIEGGYIETRGRAGAFVIASKHATATDDEGDSSYVATIEGAGLAWTGMLANTHHFTGALLSAQYLTDEEAQKRIDEGKTWFSAPDRKWRPGAYEISMSHLTPTEKTEENS